MYVCIMVLCMCTYKQLSQTTIKRAAHNVMDSRLFVSVVGYTVSNLYKQTNPRTHKAGSIYTLYIDRTKTPQHTEKTYIVA